MIYTRSPHSPESHGHRERQHDLDSDLSNMQYNEDLPPDPIHKEGHGQLHHKVIVYGF